MTAYAWLAIAIVAEVIATSTMRAAAGFTRPLPSLVTIGGYAIAFYCLSLALRTLPTGIAYAIWSGVGIVLVAAIAWGWQGQRLDAPAILGMALILVGVLVINLFSRSVAP
jgi:small multidrug resistance pump